MLEITPFTRWLQYYDSSGDDRSPFFGKEYNYDLLSENIYGYYIDPGWDFMGSETLYIKVLYADYEEGYVIIELIGEWNDAINNDVMHFKRNIIEHFLMEKISKFILIGENVLNFHGSDDCYYEEWFDDVEDGWIACVGFRDFVIDEMQNYNLDMFLNMGGSLELRKWRILSPSKFYLLVSQLIQRRIS